jgi:5-methylcytosine-specific restriction endonuclease McrA
MEWQAIRSEVRTRAGWRCQACGHPGSLDVHHVLKRSRGGSDFDLDRLVALCRACHDQTDAPLAVGRLMVTPLGDGQFAFTVVHGPEKYR